MMIKKKLKKPLYWGVTSLAHKKARKSMDSRALQENEKILSGEKIEIVHEQAVRDYSYFKELLEFGFDFLQQHNQKVQTLAIDMGSGTGVGASILSEIFTNVRIYAVEISENFIKQIMPLVFKHFNADINRIQRVVGDFNQIELENETIDKIIELDSFHHSEDLNKTLKECFRVLKPDGVMVCVDRGWPDSTSQFEINSKLDVQLNSNLKTKYHIPLNKKFTRRDFGEHEFTLCQWQNSFQKAGFDVDVFSQWHPPFLNRLFLKLPTSKTFLFLCLLQKKLGFRRHIIYGFNDNRRLFVCRKIVKSNTKY
jgi:ubiquinone/menaquinone biosynthesis C-methylase UbiE